MGLVLVVIGAILMVFVSFWIGLIVLILGLALFIVPGTPYGYGHWSGRRAPPP